MQLLSFFNRLLPVLRFSAYLKVRFALEHFAERLTDQRIVIHDQDGLRHWQNPAGIKASTVLARNFFDAIIPFPLCVQLSFVWGRAIPWHEEAQNRRMTAPRLRGSSRLKLRPAVGQ